MSSPLVNVVVPANENNFSYGRDGYSIQKITIHHMAGIMSAEQCGYLFQNPSRETSSNYGIGVNGEIGLYVGEENTSWCDSNWVSNCTSITIENSNDSYGGDWHVSDATLNSLIKLCADISKRNGLGLLVPGANLTWHSMYAATTCPGDYLRSRMQYIADEANKIIAGSLTYQAHVQDIGWQGMVRSGEVAGTTGQSLRMEAIRFGKTDLNIEADAHIEDIGWVNYGKVDENTIIGTTGESKRLECLRLKITNKDGNVCAKFRLHLAEYGWTPYTLCDGISTLGTTGQGIRVEAIQIMEI